MYDVTTTLSMFENDHEDDPAKQESSKKLLETCKMGMFHVKLPYHI